MNHSEKCQAYECKETGTVATARDPIYGQTFRVCERHATVLEKLDQYSRAQYALIGDPRALRPPMVQRDPV